MDLLDVRRVTFALLVAIVGVAAILLANRGPVFVKNCKVSATQSGGVLFQADVLTRVSSAVRDVSIIVDTVDGDALYIVPGPFAPGAWQQHRAIESSRTARLGPPGTSARLSPINKCFPQAITFGDGSGEVLYNPL